MAEAYIGQIILYAGGQIPRGFMPCDGRSLRISHHHALATLLGTTYGGDGETTFNLPDLRGRVPVGKGESVVSKRLFLLGTKEGEEAVTLTEKQVPTHRHDLAGASAPGTATASSSKGGYISSSGAVAANPVYNIYCAEPSTSQRVVLASGNLTSRGGNRPHSNMQPYTAINYLIAVEGLLPPPSL